MRCRGAYPPWGDPAQVRQAWVRFPNGYRLWIVTVRSVRRASEGIFEVGVIDLNRIIIEHEGLYSEGHDEEIDCAILARGRVHQRKLGRKSRSNARKPP